MGSYPIARVRYIGIALAVALLASASALASMKSLVPRGCIADHADDPDICGRQAQGLGGPQWVTVSPDSRSVYVAGYGDSAIVSFKRNRTTGALKAKGCIGNRGPSPDGCPRTTKGLDSAQSVAVSPNGKSVYAVGAGDNAIVSFKRNRRTGVLTPEGCIGEKGGNPAGCAKTAKGLDIASSVIVSADGKSVYVAGFGDNAVARFKRDKTTGRLTPEGCVADPANNPADCATTAKGLDSPYSVATSEDGRSVYAAGSADNAIASFKRDETTGRLTPEGCVADPANNPDACGATADGLDDDFTVAVSADGKSVYAAGSADDAIVRFNRKTSGALTSKGCIANTTSNPDGCAVTTSGLGSPYSVTPSGDGKSLYVAGFGDNAIVSFKRDKANGALMPTGCVADPAHNPGSCAQTALGLDGAYSIAVSADGTSAYAVGADDNAIVPFRRAP